jgi:CubicO group peptidase (beta-lactamase class C family)
MAGTAPRNDAEGLGFSAEQLETLNSSLLELVDDGRVAGIVTMLARHGEVVQFEPFGYQDIEAGIPMEADTIFRIYSMTKPVTGAAMMILHERGLWDLDDPVSMHVPEFDGLQVAVEDQAGGIRRVPQDHPMTMRELMTHTGGLTYGFYSQSAIDTMYLRENVLDLRSSLQTMIDKLSEIPLRQQPGSLWHYSVSVDVQGHIVEKLSGQTFPEFLSGQIFEPLGMVDTGFHVPPEKTGRLAKTVYDYGPDGELLPAAELLQGDSSTPPGLPSGGGGLVSTVSDYMRFAQMLLNGGELDGVRILSSEAVAFMRAHHAPTTMSEPGGIALGPGTGFGIDVAVTLDPAASGSRLGAGSYWWAGAAGTWFWIDPVNDLIFVAMAQHDYFDIAGIVPETQEWTYRALVRPEL